MPANSSSQIKLADLHLISLPHAVISVQGPDAEKFLQGQCSCDLATLTQQSACFGTVNSAKGRMYGLFRITPYQDGFLLRIHHDIAEAFMQQLGKYKVFFKCDMRFEADWHCYGLLAENDGTAPISDTLRAQLPDRPDQVIPMDGGLIIAHPNSQSMFEVWTQKPLANASNEGREEWYINECLAGIPELYAETVDQFILQHLNLQNLNAVSFKKGCYTGQEIIARMKYLGKLKKKTFLLHAESDLQLRPGHALYDAEGKKCGELVRAHFNARHGWVGLGILPSEEAPGMRQVFADSDANKAIQASELNYLPSE